MMDHRLEYFLNGVCKFCRIPDNWSLACHQEVCWWRQFSPPSDVNVLHGGERHLQGGPFLILAPKLSNLVA
jgi:hypothetical protein